MASGGGSAVGRCCGVQGVPMLSQACWHWLPAMPCPDSSSVLPTSHRIESAVLEMEQSLGLLCKLAISFLVHQNQQLGTHICFTG